MYRYSSWDPGSGWARGLGEPPAYCMYPHFMHFHQMYEQGGAGGQAKEVSRRFIHYYF